MIDRNAIGKKIRKRLGFFFGLFLLSVCAPPAMADLGSGPVLIPAGSFIMGTDAGTERERPLHNVWLDAFFMDPHETTNRQYETFRPGSRRSVASPCATCPVTRVTWYEAEAYCRQRGGHLPTEAQWEKAARGPEGHRYSFGPAADMRRGVFARGFLSGAQPVDSLSPNGYGLFHMSGNAWEWVRDWAGPYAPGDAKNPSGPETGRKKVVRGGSWYNAAYYAETGMRFFLSPGTALNSIGFRCAYPAGTRTGN